MNNTDNITGKRIKKVLELRDIKPAQLAEMTGFSKSRISQWINGKHKPDGQGIAEIAEKLNVNPNYLMGESDDMSYDRKKLEMGYQICDLFQKCYGKEAYKAVYDFLKLDDIDRAKIVERISTLLEDEKYSVKKESSAV